MPKERSSSSSSEEEYSMWSRPFTFGTKRVRVEEEWGVGIGGTVWEGGVLLAQYISSGAFIGKNLKGKRCLELGAGVSGLPSIAAAHLQIFKEIVVTDIEECMEGLAENLVSNLPKCCVRPEAVNKNESEAACAPRAPLTADAEDADALKNGWEVPQSVIDTAVQELPVRLRLDSADLPLSQNDTSPMDENSSPDLGHSVSTVRPSKAAEVQNIAEGPIYEGSPSMPSIDTSSQQPCQTRVVARKLDWRGSLEGFQPPYDVLLVADVVYIAELMDDLLECMHRLSAPHTLILFAYYERSATAGKVFWDLLPGFFNHKKIPEQSYGAKPHPDNLGLFKLTRKHRQAT